MIKDQPMLDSTAIIAKLAIDPDADLVASAKLELPYQTRAYETLMLRYQKLIIRICIKMLDSTEDAEDICQDVMLKIFHALPNFEGRSSFKTWLSRITTNTCLNAYDKIKRSNALKRLVLNDPTQNTTTTISSTRRDINKAMQLLDLKDRQLLTLRYVSELQIEEIADISNLGLSATKMRIYRAQEALQSLMNG